jgi:phenylacetate-CoA ligase
VGADEEVGGVTAVGASELSTTDAGRYFDPELETLERVRLDALVEQRLLASIQVAYRESALVRAVWDRAGVAVEQITSLPEFAHRAPFVEKQDLRAYLSSSNDPAAGMLGPSARPLVTMGSSSGTTGEITPKPLAFKGSMWTHLNRSFYGSGLRPDDYLMFCYFTFTLGHYFPMRELGARPIYLHHEPAAVPDLFELSRRYEPTLMYLVSVPLLLAVEEYVEREGVDPRDYFGSYRAMICGGEFLGPRLAAKAREWGLPLRMVTSAGDAVGAWQCEHTDGYHFSEDMAYIEVVDPVTGAPLPRDQGPQRGELVATALDDASLLGFTRYRSGDIVDLSHEPCACGRTHGRIWPVGRASDGIAVDGLTIYPREILPMIEDIPATRSGLFQVIRAGAADGVLHLRVGYSGPTEPVGVAEQLASAVESELNIRPRIELVPNDALLRLGPPHKIPRVVDR